MMSLFFIDGAPFCFPNKNLSRLFAHVGEKVQSVLSRGNTKITHYFFAATALAANIRQRGPKQMEQKTNRCF
jgi:hypothetical protein